MKSSLILAGFLSLSSLVSPLAFGQTTTVPVKAEVDARQTAHALIYQTSFATNILYDLYDAIKADPSIETARDDLLAATEELISVSERIVADSYEGAALQAELVKLDQANAKIVKTKEVLAAKLFAVNDLQRGNQVINAFIYPAELVASLVSLGSAN